MTHNDKRIIVEWLYLNDGNFPNKQEHRAAFMGMLDSMITEDKPLHTIGSNLGYVGKHVVTEYSHDPADWRDK